MANSQHEVTPLHSSSQRKEVEETPYALLGVLLTLYFAQGLPSGFITQALPAILRDYDVSLEMIGLTGLLLAPWALKFLWAPIVDKHFSPKWGRSRSWILPLQLLSASIVASIGLFDPNQLSSADTLWAIYALLFLLSLVGATHDVAADGLATRSLASYKTNFVDSHHSHFKETDVTNETELLHRQPMGENKDIVEVTQSVAFDIIIADTPVVTNAPLVAQAPDHDVKNPHRGMGNAVQVTGYRLGLILGGGVFLTVLGLWPWRYSFFAMAALILINTIPIWRYPENKHISSTRQHKLNDQLDPQSGFKSKDKVNELANDLTNNQANELKINDFSISTQPKSSLTFKAIVSYLKDQYGYFWHNSHMRAWLGVLLTFKIVDGISSGMVKPMMVDMGIKTAKIGLWASILGSVASLVGAILAAWLLKRIAHHNALIGFYVFQVLTTALYVVVAIGFEYPAQFGLSEQAPFWWSYAANAIEHMAAALALVAMLTMVMHYARHDKAGSDFTTQVCLLTVFSGGTHLLSGFLAAQMGYSGHFILSVVVGVLCLIPLLYWRHLFVKEMVEDALKQNVN